MLKHSLIIVPFHLPWDWSADYQRQTCLALAKDNLVVAYINDDAKFFLKPRPRHTFPSLRNIIFYQPRYIIPFRRFAQVEKLNQWMNVLYLLWRHGRGRSKSVLWIFDVVFWFWPGTRKAYPRIISLYDCVDYVWSRRATERRVVTGMERMLILGADYFFVNSHALAKLHERHRPPNAIVPQGFRLEEFRHPIPVKVKFPKDKPIVGYVGAINHRLDFRLLTSLIKRNTQWRFVLWGPVQETEKEDVLKTTKSLEELQTLPHVIVGRSRNTREIPSIIKQFDVAAIPHDVSQDAVRFSYPMKLFEYFYLGKPVVATPIEELHRLAPYVKIAKTTNEWEQNLKYLLAARRVSSQSTARRNMAIKNSWERKVQTMSRAIMSPTKDPTIAQFVRTVPYGGTFHAEVKTRSMEPTLSPGNLVRVMRCRMDEISVGDVIMYWQEHYPQPMLHRVVRKLKTKSGTVCRTKGDNVSQKDRYAVGEGQLIGKVVK